LRIRREFADLVRLDGLIKTTAAVTNYAQVAILPPQFRPERLTQFPIGFMSLNAGAGYGFTGLEISVNGSLNIVEMATTTALPATITYLRISGTYPLSPDR
jgi:hypothetical protein